jgi:hypothetical protein
MIGTKVEYIEVGYSELEQYIKEVYGQEYEIPCGEETSNDMAKTYHVDGKIGDYEERQINKWIQTGEGNYILNYLLNHMCKNGKIEAGQYVVEISW